MKRAARGSLKIQDAKTRPKFTIWTPSHNFVGLYIFATKAHIDNRTKSLLSSNSFSTCPHNMVNFGPLTTDIGLPVWGTPAKFQRVSRLAFVTAATSLSGGQLNFARCLTVSYALLYYIYIFGGSCPWRNFARCKITLRPSLVLSRIGIVTARHLSNEHQPNFAALTRGHHPIFSRAAITLGIGPHSSIRYFSVTLMVFLLPQNHE